MKSLFFCICRWKKNEGCFEFKTQRAQIKDGKRKKSKKEKKKNKSTFIFIFLRYQKYGIEPNSTQTPQRHFAL